MPTIAYDGEVILPKPGTEQITISEIPAYGTHRPQATFDGKTIFPEAEEDTTLMNSRPLPWLTTDCRLRWNNHQAGGS